MHQKKTVFFLCLLAALLSLAPAYAEESVIRKGFIEAFDANDAARMHAIVEENKEKIPDEITSLLEESRRPDVAVEHKEGNRYIAELMAIRYKDITGDAEPLIKVKKEVFNSRLTPTVRSTPSEGVHIVDIPVATGGAKNVFVPDNIIIQKGETVRWTNHDTIAHVFASMPLIGEVGLFAPSIEPGGGWEFTFEKPGEYYYICFIHKGMIGKITVEGAAAGGAGGAGGAGQAAQPAAQEPSMEHEEGSHEKGHETGAEGGAASGAEDGGAGEASE